MEMQTFEEARQRAESLGRFYCKGFGNSINAATMEIEEYVVNPRPEVVESARGFILPINNFYSRIPFDSIKNDEVFFPLFVARDLLKDYNRHFEQALASRDSWIPEELRSQQSAIIHVGRIYEESFYGALRRARSFPDGQDFRVRLEDTSGNIWNK